MGIGIYFSVSHNLLLPMHTIAHETWDLNSGLLQRIGTFSSVHNLFNIFWLMKHRFLTPFHLFSAAGLRSGRNTGSAVPWVQGPGRLPLCVPRRSAPGGVFQPQHNFQSTRTPVRDGENICCTVSDNRACGRWSYKAGRSASAPCGPSCKEIRK